MATDDGPVSEFLRRAFTTANDGPVSKPLRRIIADPATTKILTIIFSVILIITTASNVYRDWAKVPLLVIFITSLIYSCISLLVVIFKKQEAISNCNVVKKFFGGRTVQWHEIQTTMSFVFAFANIHGIVLNEFSYESATLIIFSALNIIFFSMDWYFGAFASKTFVHEENSLEGKRCLKCVTGLFNRFPFFFNTLRLGFFIAALVLVAINQSFGYSVTFYIYCVSFAILGSALLWLIQVSTKLEKSISTKLIPGHKLRTYFLLIATVYAFLAVLTFSVIVDSRQIKYESHENVYRRYYNNGGYYDRYNYYNRNDGDYLNPTTGPTTTTDYPRTTIVYYYRTQYFNAPCEAPLAFTFLCIAFVLSLLDLYSRAIHSQSRQETNEAYEPLTTKWDNLPKVITFPENNGDEPEKQIDI